MDNIPQLYPSFQHSLHGYDLAFCIELAKVGYVKILSKQVLFISDKGHISFSDYAGEKKCYGLKLPENWLIEFISIGEDLIRITFAIHERKEASHV